MMVVIVVWLGCGGGCGMVVVVVWCGCDVVAV